MPNRTTPSPARPPRRSPAFLQTLPVPRPAAKRHHCPFRNPRPAKTASMTLQPQDSAWREERDRRAIESEFLLPARASGVVDSDMGVLRERIAMLGRKEKQWADVVHQFTSMSILTGIPLIDADSGEPTARAWLFLSLSAAVPLYVLCLAAQWLHSTSVSFSHLL